MINSGSGFSVSFIAGRFGKPWRIASAKISAGSGGCWHQAAHFLTEPHAKTKMEVRLNPETGRLPVQVVEHLHRLLGGDARLERMVMSYIQFRWNAKNLFHLPPKTASEIIRRPADFLAAVKNHCEPELSFRTGTNADGQWGEALKR